MVQIGCKYTGKPAAHIDTTTGIFWEVLPKIEGDAFLLQTKMLEQAEAKAKKARKSMAKRSAVVTQE